MGRNQKVTRLLSLSDPMISKAFQHADGLKLDGRRILVDVERGRTVKTWKPRKLGGGLGKTRSGKKSDDAEKGKLNGSTSKSSPRGDRDRSRGRDAAKSSRYGSDRRSKYRDRDVRDCDRRSSRKDRRRSRSRSRSRKDRKRSDRGRNGEERRDRDRSRRSGRR